MKNQTFPGFTAEITLLKGNEQYKLQNAFLNYSATGGVIPQRFKIPWLTYSCDCEPGTDNCVCYRVNDTGLRMYRA